MTVLFKGSEAKPHTILDLNVQGGSSSGQQMSDGGSKWKKFE